MRCDPGRTGRVAGPTVRGRRDCHTWDSAGSTEARTEFPFHTKQNPEPLKLPLQFSGRGKDSNPTLTEPIDAAQQHSQHIDQATSTACITVPGNDQR